MDPALKQHLTAKQTWQRALFIVIFAIIYSVAEVVLGAVVVFQFAATLFTGVKNERLLQFGASLSTYMYQVLTYVTYNRDERPYPFAPWPTATENAGAEQPAPPPPASDPGNTSAPNDSA